MEATSLIAEAKSLIKRAESVVEKIEHAEPTQLRIVVSRLRLFLEQHAGVDAEIEENEAAPDDEPQETPKRRGRPPKAASES